MFKVADWVYHKAEIRIGQITKIEELPMPTKKNNICITVAIPKIRSSENDIIPEYVWAYNKNGIRKATKKEIEMTKAYISAVKL